MGESKAIQFPALSTALSLNEGIADVLPTPTGFSLRGKMPGETMVQAFGESNIAVYVVNVTPPPPGPPAPPRLPTLGERGPLQSFWGANSYSAHVQRLSTGDWQSLHSLSLQGRTLGGEHLASAQMYVSNLGHQLQQASIGWISDDRSLGFEVGDTSGRIEGVTALSGIGLKGLSARRLHPMGPGRGELGYEVFAGSLRGPADPTGVRFSQPVAGGLLHRSWNTARGLRLRLATSILGFETASSAFSVGQTGMVAGNSLRAFLDNGLSFEARAALSIVRPNGERSRGIAAAALGATILYGSNRRSGRLDYEGNQRDFVQPQSTTGLPGSHRIAGSIGQKFGTVSATGSASFAHVAYAGRPAGSVYSFRLQAAAPLGTQDRLTLNVGESSLILPSGGLSGSGLRSFRNDLVGARLEHSVANHPIEVQAELNYVGSESDDSASRGGMGGISIQRRRDDRWEASGTLAVSASHMRSKTEVLASDQSPLVVGTSISANARLIQGPFESFGGLGLNATSMPVASLSPTANLGIQFTPTSAHRLTSAMTVSRYANSRTVWSLSAGYTHHFGDAVRARPVLEFLRVGRIEGRVCFDENQDGTCTENEPSIPNVPVVLSDGRTTITDAKGRYAFQGVKPGFYSIEADESALRRQGRPTTMLSSTFELEPRAEKRFSVGVARSCRIRGHIIHDLNLDGLGSQDEPLFGLGTVVFTHSGGTIPVRVDPQGTFAESVPCGEYDVEVDAASLPELHLPGTLATPHVHATPGEIPSVVLLVRAIRTIAGEVFVDRNGNGERDPDEPTLAGATVRMGKVAARSDASGAFFIRRVPAGSGKITVEESTLPPGYRPGPPRPLSLPSTPTAIEGLQIPVLPR